MQPRPLLPLRRRPCRPVPVSGGFPAQSSWPETEVTAAEIGPKIERSKVADNGHLIRLYDTRDAARIDKYDTVYRGFLYEFEPQMQLITEAYLMSAVISVQEPNEWSPRCIATRSISHEIEIATSCFAAPIALFNLV